MTSKLASTMVHQSKYVIYYVVIYVHDHERQKSLKIAVYRKKKDVQILFYEAIL